MVRLQNERERAVLSMVGRNKLGTVALATKFLKEHEASVESLHAARLGSLFGLQVLFVTRPSNMTMIRRCYREELAEYAPVLVAASPREVNRDLRAVHCDLTVFCYDDVGIVNSLTSVLSDDAFRVDIASLASSQYPAPHSGTPLFVVEMKLDVPKATPLSSLQSALHRLSDQRGWDLELRRESPVNLTVPSMPFPPSKVTNRVEKPARRATVAEQVCPN